MPTSVAFVFNQYYFDVLKKIKDIGRSWKYDDKIARGVLKAVKRHYLSYDRQSPIYRDEVRGWLADPEHEKAAQVWNDYLALSPDTPMDILDTALDAEEWAAIPLFRDIPVSVVRHMLRKQPGVIHHYLSILVFLSQDLAEDHVSALVKAARVIGKEPVPLPEDAALRSLLMRLESLHKASIESKGKHVENHLKEMEDTTLGKLAKEIMDEVDVNTLQQSLGDGDIFSALGNPNSGIMSLLGTVSQKMIAKMASGEMRQEALLQDAMKFASKIPNMMPGADMQAMGNMMQMMQGMANMGGNGSGSDGEDASGPVPNFDIASMMRQFGLGGAGGRTKPKARDLRRRMDRKKDTNKK